MDLAGLFSGAAGIKRMVNSRRNQLRRHAESQQQMARKMTEFFARKDKRYNNTPFAEWRLSATLKIRYAEEIARRKRISRSGVLRCIGSTLLVKGLEFDHAVIFCDPHWQNSWGRHRTFYVALTHGSKSVSLADLVH